MNKKNKFAVKNKKLLFLIFCLIFITINIFSLDFYWENPKIFVNADSYFPLAVKNSSENFIFWEEVDFEKKQIFISCRRYKNFYDYSDTRRFAGPFFYSGNEIPDIYSAAVLENGTIAVSVVSQDGEIFIFTSADSGKNFEKIKLESKNLQVAPKLFADFQDNFRLFVSVGKEKSFSICTSISSDGKNWSNITNFPPSEKFSNVFVPVLQKTKNCDFVIFQAQYLSAETKRISFQLYLTKRTEKGWSEPVLLTDAKSLQQKNKKQFYEYQNQRASILQFGENYWFAWERTEDINSSIWIAQFDENGTAEGTACQLTVRANASRPILFEYNDDLYITWFDNRNGNNALFTAKKNGEYYDETEIFSDENSNIFVYPMILNNRLSFVWQQNQKIALLAPDDTVFPPKLKPLSFTEGKKSNKKDLQVQIIFPQDSSEIAGYSYTWGKNDSQSEPPKIIEHFTKDDKLKLKVQGDGENILKVKIVDYAGNWSETAQISYFVDLIPPVAPKINITNKDKWGFIDSNTFSLAWDKSESEDTKGYFYRLDYVGNIPKSISVSKNHPLKLNSWEVLKIKNSLLKKYEKELTKKRKTENQNFTDRLNTKKFENYKNGIWVFSVAGIDECGNIGETSSELIILNKYEPQTFINSVEIQKNETKEIILSVYGGGFTYDGTISEIYIDKDGYEPWDLVLKKDKNNFKVLSDSKISNINIGSDLEEGEYKIGLFHTDRGLFLSKNIIKTEQTGTVKIQGEYKRQSKLIKNFKIYKYNIVLNLVIWILIIILSVIAILFLIGISVKSYSEKKLIQKEVKAFAKGDIMPFEKNQYKKRQPSLKGKLVFSIYMFVVIIVLSVTLQNGVRIIELQKETMAKALESKVNVLLESLCSGVKNFFPVNNLLELSVLPEQKNAVEEVNYITIIGQKHNQTSANNLNYVWATNDREIIQKIDSSTLVYGESELIDPKITEITRKFINLDFDIANNLRELSDRIEKLTKQAEELYKSSLQEDIDEAERLSLTITELRNQTDIKLSEYSAKAAGSEPYFDINEIDTKNREFIFYKPVLYRQGTTNNWVHAVVYLELSTQNLIDEINKMLFKIINSALLIGVIAVTIGGLGAYFFATVIVHPIKKLESHVIMIGRTKNKIHLKGKDIIIKQKDEIGRLGQAINNMTHELISNAEEEEIVMDGKAVQNAFLPLENSGLNNKNTFAKYSDKNIECFGYYEGESGVSGDYFDWKKLDDTWFCVIKCDASGHGIPAAIIMTVVATIFRRYFENWTYKKDGVNLNILVEQINDFIEGLGLKGKFATLIICLLNMKSGELFMCNAGDNLIHIFDSETKKIKILKLSPTPTAGIFTSDFVATKSKFTVEKTVLKQNDILFLYTDGIEESTRKVRNKDYSVKQNKIETKKINPKTQKEETEITFEDVKEEFGYDRIVQIIESVLNKKKWVLTKQENPNTTEKLEFDFTKSQGTLNEAILALVSAEKVFRFYKSPEISQTNYVKVDKNIDDFLLKYFNIYSEYATKKSENTTNENNYIDYDMLQEDEQSDDLTLLAIKRK